MWRPLENDLSGHVWWSCLLESSPFWNVNQTLDLNIQSLSQSRLVNVCGGRGVNVQHVHTSQSNSGVHRKLWFCRFRTHMHSTLELQEYWYRYKTRNDGVNHRKRDHSSLHCSGSVSVVIKWKETNVEIAAVSKRHSSQQQSKTAEKLDADLSAELAIWRDIRTGSILKIPSCMVFGGLKTGTPLSSPVQMVFPYFNAEKVGALLRLNFSYCCLVSLHKLLDPSWAISGSRKKAEALKNQRSWKRSAWTESVSHCLVGQLRAALTHLRSARWIFGRMLKLSGSVGHSSRDPTWICIY